MFKFSEEMVARLYLRQETNPHEILNVRDIYDFESQDEEKEFIPLLNVRRPNAIVDQRDLLLQMAHLAQDAYSDNAGEIPEPWKVLTRTSTNISSGYFGSAYYSDENGSLVIAIAHRGTASIKDIWQDFRIFKNWTLTQATDANKFADRTIRYAYDMFKKIDPMTGRYEDIDSFMFRIGVIHVGHSLGAALAELVSIASHGYAYTFENPGTKEIFVKLIDDMTITDEGKKYLKDYIFNQFAPDHFYNYLSHINFINSYNTQIGRIFRMVNKPYNFDLIPESYLKVPFEIPLGPVNNYYFEYSLDQHYLSPMIDYIAKKGRITSDTSPVGLSNGYFEYLNPDRHAVYWRDYFWACWNYGQDHTKYTPNEKTFEDFLHHGIEVLADMRRRYYTNRVKAPIPAKPLVTQKGLFGNRPIEMIFPERNATQVQNNAQEALPPYIEPSAPDIDDILEKPTLNAEDYDYSDLVRHSNMPFRFFERPKEFNIDDVPFNERRKHIRDKINHLQLQIAVWSSIDDTIKRQEERSNCLVM